ncbi:NAD-dependent epimerase/dehydratase family protein [Microbacterium pygmaeum]|uniref:Nucleoside-diphosphate-sugar epimerase n=1 Tax=Microbacterium pygmaeum TaxID=370764 RepID=A0A1G8CSG6_9MICO|nr:NAD-dependent epimerase/dehydratase family protein [Microbacterium pygmaeum]SDH48274.1 Nucleoside-diphosphate-sugar epimerase [Microbacterium pygmaeum]
MTRRLIVTGVDGFVGRHLARLGADAGFEVFGVSRTKSPDRSLGANLSGYASADLRERWPADAPSDAVVVHLAGLAAVGASFDRPQDYLAGNSAMITTMCEARLAQRATGRVVGVSTGAVYANDGQRVATSENDDVAFSSPYVVSKVLVENQFAYYRARGLNSVIARPFNHIGPGQGPGFLVPDLLRQLRDLGSGQPLHVGNLSTARDYTDVRDVARAYLALAAADHLPHTLYNVASGVARTGRELLSKLCDAVGIPVPPLEVDASRIRAADPARIVGDATRLRDDLGWAPRIPFSQTIADTIDD